MFELKSVKTAPILFQIPAFMKVGHLQHRRGLLSDEELQERKRKCSEIAKDLVSCFKFEFI